jgi:hypothetical protein
MAPAIAQLVAAQPFHLHQERRELIFRQTPPLLPRYENASSTTSTVGATKSGLSAAIIVPVFMVFFAVCVGMA